MTKTDTGAELKPEGLWEFPEWMGPYRELINGHGGNEVAKLVNRLRREKNLAFTNMIVFVMACEVTAQVQLLERLHSQKLLPDLCSTCHGLGVVRGFGGDASEELTCADCDGTGRKE